MNRRAQRDAQLALPGLAPLCPHCGARRTELLPAAGGDTDGVVSGQRWHCRACERDFWSLPTLAAADRAPR
jgi:transposase-like protein